MIASWIALPFGMSLQPTERFPAGALYAVHDDRAVSAFELGEVVRALGLDPACVP